MATYEQWVESLGLPIHKGYYIEDLRTVEMGWWEERGCNTAFIQMFGLEDVAEIRVTGIPPGKTTLPWKSVLDDIYYVLEGKGLTTVWIDGQSSRKTFEWQPHSLFLIPRYSFYQLTNAQGDKPAKLLSHSRLPLAMKAVEDPEFFFNNPYVPRRGVMLEDFYSEAKKQWGEDYFGTGYIWYGNFFPDMAAWDKLEPLKRRGAGGQVVIIKFPNLSLRDISMSVFPAERYKKAHRHVAGNFIIIPAGEGYSVMWDDRKEEERIFKERMIIPWHECSCFAPQFYHQHFNVGLTPARYLKFGYGGMKDYAARHLPKHQIEYPDEDPWVRQNFEKELAKRGLTSLMPDGVYKDRDYQWEYAEDSEGD